MKKGNYTGKYKKFTPKNPMVDEKVKTSGVKIRGTGAATKGTMARGPMA